MMNATTKKRKRASESELEAKYFMALKKAKEVLDETNIVSLTKLAKKQGVSPALGKILQDGGILEKEDGKSNSYRWTGKNPDLAMAKETRRRVAMYVNSNNYEELAKEPIKRAIEKKKEPQQFYPEIFGIKLKFIKLRVKN